MYVDALVKHIVTYLWNQRFLTQKCVNTAYLSRKWVNTAFLLRKFVNTAFFVAKFCKYALIDSFQGYSAVVDSSASCAALFLTLIEGFTEVELMVTKRDDRRQPTG